MAVRPWPPLREGPEGGDQAACAHRAQVRLSSAAVPDESDDTTVVIGPPFYLEAKLAGLTIPIQDTQPGGGRKSILGEGAAFLL